MVQVKSISKNYGEKILFSDANFFINSDDRIGLVGSNGSGKSTLLKIISGFDTPSNGEIQKANDVKIEYLPQEIDFYSDNTLFMEVSESFREIFDLKEKIEIIHHKLVQDPTNEKLIDNLGQFESRYQHLDAYSLNYKVARVLSGLGFKESDHNRLVEEFSGGWKMRILLAKMLLREPSLLLLDEPTNHLDLNSLEWLEEYLRNFKGGVVIVSHDRTFLDNLTNRTIEIASGKVSDYKGNYTFYVTESEKRRENLISTLRNQQEKIKQTQRFIERFRYKATKARQVQSRIKMLEKMEFVEIDDNEDQIDFFFPESHPSGRIIATLSGLSKRYGENSVLDNIDLTIERGDKIALLGPNGTGKSTLLKILADVDSIFSGSLTFGHNVLKSYFAQEQSMELDKTKTIYQTIEEVATGEIRKMIRTLLGSFLFSGDDIFKDVGVLSGGEKSRVALAKMLLSPSNFLILDEPTNHLDISSKDILKKALKDYSGSILIASHDRDFLNPIINKVIDIENGKIKMFSGNIDDYLHMKKTYSSSINPGNNEKPSSDSNNLNPKERKKIEAELRQKKYSLTRPLREKIHSLEKEIGSLEMTIQNLETEMTQPDYFKNTERVISSAKEYDSSKSKLDDLYSLWEKYQEELVEIEKSII
jgi:ATP-binding cassette, subfamily F, member 3